MWTYCSKEDVQDFSGVSKDSMRDSWSMIVEDMIEAHTGTTYGGTQAYTESYDGDGTDTLILKHVPVVSVSSLSVDSVSMSSSEYKVYTSGYIRLVGSTGTSLESALGAVGSAFPVGPQNITVSYTAEVAQVPGRVRLAAILMISEIALIHERGGSDGSLAVSRAVSRAGERDLQFPFSDDLSARLRRIMRNTIGEKWKFN